MHILFKNSESSNSKNMEHSLDSRPTLTQCQGGIKVLHGLNYNDDAMHKVAEKKNSWIWRHEDGLNKSELDLYVPRISADNRLNGHNKQNGGQGERQVGPSRAQGGPTRLQSGPNFTSRESADDEELLDGNLNKTKSKENTISSTKPPPLVVFIHGGGWRRGHPTSWKYFISKYDTNIFMALVHQLIFRFYENFGNTLAENGIPCAVISYPISRLHFPWVIAEFITSFMTNYLMFGASFVLGLIFLAILGYPPVTLQHYLLETTWTNLTPPLATLIVHGGITQLLIWVVIVFNSKNYDLTKQAAVLLPVCLTSISYMTSQFIMTSQHHMVTFSFIFIMTSQLSLLYIQTRIPIVQHPQPVKSVARCIAWLQKSRKLQGLYDPESIVLLGHSAGGHLATLITLHNKYLTEAGCHPRVIKGVISVSGVYSVTRIATSWMARRFIIIPAFGTDQSEWEKSSPLTHVKYRTMAGINIPKFLLFCAENEFPFLQKDASDLSDKFNEFDVANEYFIIKGTNHFTIASKFGRHSSHYNEHVTKYCIDFINSINK